MKEFGSNFHYVSCGPAAVNASSESRTLYGDGRQALVNLYQSQGWKRLWVPEYFCYDVLSSWEKAGLKISFYPDYPGADDEPVIRSIAFQSGDALLRINYFGVRKFRSNKGIPVTVVEDHTHDLMGDWVLRSDADYCIASLRKTLPVAEGGALWSPKGLPLPPAPPVSAYNESVAARRWEAMRLKAQYLEGAPIDKQAFLRVFLETEAYFDSASVSRIDNQSQLFLQGFDITGWNARKLRNFDALSMIASQHFSYMVPEDGNCNPFSFIIICETPEYRDKLRHELILQDIYPAVLWSIPLDIPASEKAKSFSRRMLSIHCDGRYSIEDMELLRSRLELLTAL